MKNHLKIGFIGLGNMAQNIIQGLLEQNVATPQQVFGSNRSPGKLQKVVDHWKIQGLKTNEEVIDAADVIILATKPQDFASAIDPVISSFLPHHIVLSLAAGITLQALQKKIPQARVVRVIPNIPTQIKNGVIGYFSSENENSIDLVVEDLFQPLGSVFKMENEEQLEALMISTSSGVGFVYELMMYFADWIEERGFDTPTARKMVVDTFLGASQLASQHPETSLEELQNKVASRKGVTAAGLESMRESEIERLLRISFGKSVLRNQELAKLS